MDSIVTETRAALHPLDPLSGAELARAAELIVKHFDWGADLRVETVDLDEPAKDLVRDYVDGASFPRIARFNIYRRGVMGVIIGRVDLGSGELVSQVFREDARAMVAIEEVFEIEKTVKADPRFQDALRKRGLIDDLEFMAVDPWTVGDFGHAIEQGRRVLNCFIWMRTFPLDNYYAHPVEGLHALIDVSTLEVLEVVDHFAESGDYIPVPRTPRNYDAALLTEFRPPSSALDVVQPDGAGFKVEGHKVTWENWDFRVGFNGREGLVLYRIGYTHGGERRPIVYRASIAEMVVPYGTPERSHYRKNVFDSGELGFGRMANSLTLGCDCLGTIHYFDAVVPTVYGTPRTITNAICLHEEDAGLAWKHFDVRTERTDVRRARKLVISSISTIGNYEYASYWYLHQDGRIEYEMKATGIINTAACHPGQPGKFGTEVAPGIVGHIHQHIFCARLDMEVDGPNNTVTECDTRALPLGPENPYGNAFLMEEKPLISELAAQRDVDFAKSRYWRITNPEVKNWVGKPTAFKLEPMSAVQAYTHPDSPSGRRGRFIQHQVWVTAYNPEERYPAGEFVNQSSTKEGGSEGLPQWTKADRPTDNTDIVLWHSFGLHHITRPEDHPVQPCVVCGFKLMPSGFFDQNPVIDLPPAVNKKSCCA
ncbi:primary-amine oxidase [Acidisoma cellulosilytica]|uniref:Amine oxidase n=1 Tax=Acidisoma cellulosilyticum TaxID=2802395 RepID=A0A963Z1R7_9PROT|nr:primary-amine oxidase [Acidisoma cellulosilyticum]MCB8881233.1 primary-amine oxidase [Acidisoma cellulosilyticum]